MIFKRLRILRFDHRVLVLSSLASVIAQLSLVHSATHDELPQCGLSGVYKTRQSVVESPNYPNNYPTNTCWDYVIRSPYRCPTKFHIQFLDFHLESSDNCTNDYLAIGLENDGDDMDLLCGQVVGIKKYHTPDGILRLRFYADNSPWTTARGFKLLITRLACEREDSLREILDGTDEDTEHYLTLSGDFQPPRNSSPELFRNWTQIEQHLPFHVAPLFGWNTPGHLPVPPPPYAGFGGLYVPQPTQMNVNEKPCVEQKGVGHPYAPYPHPSALGYRNNDEQKPLSPDQYVGVLQTATQGQEREQALKAENLVKLVNNVQSRQQFQGNVPFGGPQFTTPYDTQFGSPFPKFQSAGAQFGTPQFGGLPFPGAQFGDAQGGDATPERPPPTGDALSPSAQQCCTTSFNQKRFYLSSPGFPRTAFTTLLPAQQRDCLFALEKSTDNICLLRIEFKYFNFGQPLGGTGDLQGNINGAVSTSHHICTEDFLEINGERFCGCRTGYTYTSPWVVGTKQIRMRIGYSGIPASGFILDIYQEECRGSEYEQSQRPTQSVSQPARGGQNNDSVGGQQSSAGVQNSLDLTPPTTLRQQQLPLYQQPPHFRETPSPPTSTLPLDQIPYRPLQTPSINPFLPPYHQPPPSHLWPTPTIQPPPYANLYNQFGSPLALYRQGKIMNLPAAASTHQPVTVVETNSTRKEYYYIDGDEAFGRLRAANDEPNDIDRNGIAPAALPVAEVGTTADRDHCIFSTTDVLRLTVDSLWIAKPTCYAPVRSWFSSSAFG